MRKPTGYSSISLVGFLLASDLGMLYTLSVIQQINAAEWIIILNNCGSDRDLCEKGIMKSGDNG